MPNFMNPYSKAYEEESPIKIKAQKPTKKTKEQERSRERSVGKAIYSKAQIYNRI